MSPFTFDKLDKIKQRIVLKVVRKEVIRARLVEYIDSHPILARENAKEAIYSLRSLQLLFLALVKPQVVSYFAAILILAIAGAGTSYAAEQALPGDILYPIKIHVNEEVRGAFAVSTEAKASWEAIRAERRLDEASELAVEKKLDDKSRKSLEEAFQKHVGKLRAHIKTLEVENRNEEAAIITSNFETSLKVHGEVLGEIDRREGEEGPTSSDLIKQKTGPKAGISSLKTAVSDAFFDAKQSRVEAEARVAKANNNEIKAKVAAEARINLAMTAIAKIGSLVNLAGSAIDYETKSRAETKTLAAKTFLIEARAGFDDRKYGQAFNSASKAIRAAEESSLLLQAENKLHLKIRSVPEEESKNGKSSGDKTQELPNTNATDESRSGSSGRRED